MSALRQYVDTKISDSVGGASPAMDTLREISESLNNDGNVFTTLSNMISGRVSKTQNDQTISGNNLVISGTNPTVNERLTLLDGARYCCGAVSCPVSTSQILRTFQREAAAADAN